MKKLSLLTISLFLSLAFVTDVSAQTDEERIVELRRQIETLEREAEKYRDSIDYEHSKAESLQRDISILKNETSKLEAQISATVKKIDKTKIEITGVRGNILEAKEKINKQKGSVARLILFFNRLDNENLMETLIKNENISDFFRQEQYANNISKELLDTINDLKEARSTLENNEEQLEIKQDELEQYNREQAAKKASLVSVKVSKDSLLKKSKGQEAQYQKLLVDVERKKAEFFTELQKLEDDIVAGGLYIVTVKATGLPKKGTKLFKWPEAKYRITQSYGKTAYSRRGAYGGAPHNGIDMASGFGSEIKSIGDGEIIANGSNSGWGNWVAIKHNAYNLVSVYGHMSVLSTLKVGTRVSTSTVIGYEGATGNATGSHLHLSLYKNFFTYEKKGELYFNYFDGSINPLDYM